jgi:hypothetical protein
MLPRHAEHVEADAQPADTSVAVLPDADAVALPPPAGRGEPGGSSRPVCVVRPREETAERG